MARTNLPNLTVQQLEYLVAAASAPTRAVAAASLGVTPSALTQGLAELERRVGVSLFERSGRMTRLRPQADLVLDHARRVVAETRDLARWAEKRRTGNLGVVRLGAIDAVAVHHRAETIRHYRRAFPEVDLRLIVAPSSTLLEALLVGDLDLVVCVEPGISVSGVSVQPCLSEALHAYAPDGVVVGSPDSWGPWVTYPMGSHTRELIATGLSNVGARFAVVAESNQPEVLREMVRLGMGWSVLPETQASTTAEPLTKARLRPVAVRRIVVAHRSGVPVDAAVEALAGALVAS